MQFDCSSHIPQKFLCRTAFEVKITIPRGSSQLIGSNRTVWSEFQNYNESLSLNPFFFYFNNDESLTLFDESLSLR